jgi:hypothetical protein
MSRRFACGLGLALLLAAALGACASERPAKAWSGQDAAQVMVMIPVAPPHFRGAATYGGGYDERLGHLARLRIAEDLAQAQGLELVSEWPMPSLAVECFLMRLPQERPLEAVLRELARDERVAWAQPLHVYRMLGHDDPLFALQPGANAWHLAEIHAVATGRGVSVAVVDSGVEPDHPDLAGRIALSRNFVDAGPEAAELHGTAVAGIIAADADNGIGIVGVAPEARLLALRACWQAVAGAAQCDSFALAKALQFALQHHAQVINLSLSGPEDILLRRLLQAALSQGASVVCAMDPQAPDGGFPASLPGVVAVAADEDAGADWAVTAPGRDIPATLPQARWGFVSGSSFAAAQVSGALALMRELAPSLSPWQLRERLLSSGPAAATEGASLRHGSSRASVCVALARAAGVCACRCSPRAGPAVVSQR